MRIGVLILVGVFVFFGNGQVFGQVEGDTVVARRLLNEVDMLNKQRRYDEAFLKADSARIIFTKELGAETKEMADVLQQMGIVRFYQRNYDLAVELCEKAKEIRIKALGSDHLDVAKSFNSIGFLFDSKGEYKKAIENKQKALEIRLKVLGLEHPEVATAYNNIGVTHASNGEYDKAIEYYKIALNIRLKTLGSEHPEVAASNGFIGVSLDSKGEYEKALEYKKKWLEIQSKTLGKEHPSVAIAYNSLGISFQFNGEYDLAIQCVQKALEIRLKIFGLSHQDVAKTYINLGVIYQSKGEFNMAIKYLQKSLEIGKISLGPEHPILAKSYNNLGISFQAKGEYNIAIDYYQKALAIELKTFGEVHPDVGSIYNNLGMSYELKKECNTAVEYFHKGLEIRIKTLGLKHPEVAASYNNIGVSFDSKGDYDKAIENYEKALETRLTPLGEAHPDIASFYNNIGVSYNSKNDFEKAIKYIQKGLDLRLKILEPNHPDLTSSYNDIGSSYYLKGDYETAIKYFKMTIDLYNHPNNNFSIVNFPEQLLIAFNGLCKVLQSKYDQSHDSKLLGLIFGNAIQALSLIDYQQSTFSDASSKSHWLSKNYPIYEQAISVSLLKADVDHNDTLRHTTFTYAEKSKASLLQAQIKAADAINFSGIPDSLLQKEHDLRIDITWREKQRQSLLDKGLSETDTNTLRISSIIFDLKRDYETLKKRFETEYPEYYRLKYDLSTVSLQYVQDTLLEPKNQALLEYFVGDSSIFLFVVRPDTMIVEEVKRDFPLEDWIQGLRYGLYGYYTTEKMFQTDSLKADARSKYLEFAPKLYEKLVAPVAQYLPEKVILVPDGPLGYVPFDALLTGAPEDLNNFKSYPYLLQKHQFSYTYSATLLREMRDKKHRQEPEKDFIAFAPFYNGDTTLLASMYAYDELMRKDLQPLAYTGPEVAAASKLMRGETIAGAAATEERFTSMASDYRIIHLATHGRADNRVGDYAFLAFTEIKDSIENELLYVKDLYNLSLNADLVVLSACETGIGKLQRGEGIISLARAFAYAGAKSIVTSLWSVNDKSTSELMRFFYRELKRGKDKDEALRLARLRFLKESSVRNSHPFFWAAFVPIGDMRPVK